MLYKRRYLSLDHHQRSHWNTISIGLKEMINRVLQFNISQLEDSFNSHLEKTLQVGSPKPTHFPNPIDDRTGKPVEESSHNVQEVGSLEHRDDVNKFNLAIDEENIDFNISGVPNAMVKRSQSINVHNLIQKIESHPQREALQSDLQQHRAFNPFSKESKDCDYGCWEHRTMPDSRRGAEITVQSMLNALERRNCVLHMWTLYERWYYRKQEVHLIRAWFVLHPELLHKEGPTTRSQVRGKHLDAKNTTRQINFKIGVARRNMTTSTIDSSATSSSEKRWSSWVALKRSFLRWIGLQAKTTVHIATEEIDVYRGNWWIRSNVVNFDTMPTRRQLDFKKALSTLYRLKKAEDKKHYENWSHSYSSWWQWKTNWREPYYDNSPQMEWTHWLNGETCVLSASTIHLRHESQQELNAKFIVIIS